MITDGLYATPRPPDTESTGRSQWQLPVEVTLENTGKQAAAVTVQIEVVDPSGKVVAQQDQRATVPLFAQATVSFPVSVNAPALWSLDRTNLYHVSARVLQDNKKIDEVALDTGFRRIRFDADQGFFLNDRHLKLKGVCLHQDHAGVGVAVPLSIWEYRLRRLKELGVNAIRFSHNAPDAEVLNLVDRMGFLVMDENRNFNPSPDYMRQLEWMVRRDRHHPGIIFWSVFNEEPMQGSEAGYEMVRRMAAAVKALDDTRPVTAAMSDGLFNPVNVSQAVDVAGLNYQVPSYDRFHKANPRLPMTSSEDTSAFMTRGEFTTDKSKNLIASYDDEFAPWGNSHMDAWQAIDTRPFMAGGFIWTGFDYRGEPTPNEWPSVSSVFGIMDMNGFPKTAYFLHQVQWIKDRPLIYIAPHWNWSGKEGQDIRVMVMANTERVKLMLNGKTIGEQKADPYRMNTFQVAYAPGRLEAIGINGEREVARAAVETTGTAVALQLLPDRKNLSGDGWDAMPVTVQAVDAQGRVVPEADNEVTFEIRGAGKSLGHGNGNPNSHENEKGKTRQLFHGLAALIVQSQAGGAGTLDIAASAAGLKTAKTSIQIKAAAPLAAVVASAPISLLHTWRISPASANRPDPNQMVADNDMNSWGSGHVPMDEPPQPNANWRLFRTDFTPRADLADGGAHIVFAHINGKAEIWLDGKLLGKTDGYDSRNFSVKLPAGNKKRVMTVVVEAQENKTSGIDDLVTIKK